MDDGFISFLSPSSCSCAVCSRSVTRALACVDTTSGEVLCPIHFRQRSFKKIFSQRRLERWALLSPNIHTPETCRAKSTTPQHKAFELRDSLKHWKYVTHCGKARLHRDGALLRLRQRFAYWHRHRSTAWLHAKANRLHVSKHYNRLRSIVHRRDLLRHAAYSLHLQLSCSRTLRVWIAFCSRHRRLAHEWCRAVAGSSTRQQHRSLYRWLASSQFIMLGKVESEVAMKFYRLHALRASLRRVQLHVQLELHIIRVVETFIGRAASRYLRSSFLSWHQFTSSHVAADASALSQAARAHAGSDIPSNTATSRMPCDCPIEADQSISAASLNNLASVLWHEDVGSSFASPSVSPAICLDQVAARPANNLEASPLSRTVQAVAAELRAADSKQQLAEAMAYISQLEKLLAASCTSESHLKSKCASLQRERDMLLDELGNALQRLAAVGHPRPKPPRRRCRGSAVLSALAVCKSDPAIAQSQPGSETREEGTQTSLRHNGEAHRCCVGDGLRGNVSSLTSGHTNENGYDLGRQEERATVRKKRVTVLYDVL